MLRPHYFVSFYMPAFLCLPNTWRFARWWLGSFYHQWDKKDIHWLETTIHSISHFRKEGWTRGVTTIVNALLSPATPNKWVWLYSSHSISMYSYSYRPGT